MRLKRLAGRLCAAAAYIAVCASSPVLAGSEPASPLKIGVLTDMSGTYADISGPGAVEAARMAVEDHGGKVLGRPIEVLVSDHQNKADVGAARAREWYDSDVRAIFEMIASSVALAVFDVATSKERIAIASGAATSALTNKSCSPFGIHWVYDTYALAAGTGRTMAREPGSKSWYFVTVDYAFGHALEADTAKFVKEAGGNVVGVSRHPLAASDFSSYMLKAQSSGANVVALANAGSNMVNSVRQAREFGIVQGGQKLVALLPHLTDIHALGLDTAQGLILTEGFYWDRTDATRAWSKRFFERRKAMPTMVQAGVYSSVRHYLKAVEAAGTDESKAVMAKMREMPVNDFFAENGKVRADGRMIHDMYLVQVKTPAESKYPWDYYRILATIPGDEAFRPVSESECPLLRTPG